MSRFLIATIAAVLVFPAAARAEEPEVKYEWNWAALAYSRRSDKFGKAFSEKSEYVAKTAAIRACGKSDCEIKTYVELGCAAIGRAFESGSSGRMWTGFGAAAFRRSTGSSTISQMRAVRFEAAERAKEAARLGARSNSASLVDSYCTWDADKEVSRDELSSWIASQGGEWDRGMRNLLQLVNVMNDTHKLNFGATLEQATCLTGRQWSSVSRFVSECGISLNALERLYSEANAWSGN